MLPLPAKERPLPLLPEVDEKSITALLIPEIFTPAGTLTEPDLTVPFITIVVPDLALLIAAERVVPPSLTSMLLPEITGVEGDLVVVVVTFVPEELLVVVVTVGAVEPEFTFSNINCWQARPL